MTAGAPHRVMLYRSMLDLIGTPPLVEMPNLSPSPAVRFFAKLEGQNPTGSVKDRIAKTMIEDAERDGLLTPGCTILEPTSGNTGVSLAFVAGLQGYKVRVVMPDNVSEERTALLRAYGAEIVYSEGLMGTNGSIVVAQEMAAADPSLIMLYQYGNEANPRAHYETTGPEILRDLPEVDVFIAGLGTGGTLTGAGRPRAGGGAAGGGASPRRCSTRQCWTAASSSTRAARSRRRRSCSNARASSPASPPEPCCERRRRSPTASSARTWSSSSLTAAGSTSRRTSGRLTTATCRRTSTPRSGGDERLRPLAYGHRA